MPATCRRPRIRLPRSIHTTAALLLAAALLPGSARALPVVVFDNGTSDGSLGLFNDTSFDQRTASDFSFASPTRVDGINFDGGYFGGDNPSSADSFTITFYADASGLPNGSSVVATRTAMGTVTGTGGVSTVTNYFYETTLDAPVDFAGGSVFWVNVLNDPTGTADDWIWNQSAFDSGNGALSSDAGATWVLVENRLPPAREFAFQLTQVPEPSTALLLGLAIGAFGAIRRRADGSR